LPKQVKEELNHIPHISLAQTSQRRKKGNEYTI